MGGYFQDKSNSQLAIISIGVALLLHVVLGFGFWNTDYNIPLLEGEVLVKNDDVEAEIDIPEEQLRAQIEDSPRLRPQDIKSISSNSADDREESDEEFSQHARYGAAGSQGDDVKSEVNDYVEKLKAEAAANRGDVTSSLPKVKDYDIKPVEGDGGDGNNKKFAGKTMADCFLSNPSRKSRDSRGLEIPGYTGQGGGEIYVNVVVDQIGYVISAEIDYSRTTITEQFALDKALQLAKSERFVRNMSAPKKQSGYFRYTYVGQ